MLRSIAAKLLVLTVTLAGLVRAECPAGDLNGDCQVGFEDLRVLAEKWLESPETDADLSGDSDVDMEDFGLLAGNWHRIGSTAVINEIHYDPDVKTELVEYVELHNPGPADVDLSGWSFCDGISYTFPVGSTLRAGGYIIVAYDPNHIHAKWSQGRFGIQPHLVFGPFTGKLGNEGEKIELCDAAGEEVDQVDYQLGFPWPTVGDAIPDGAYGTGHSIQLTNPYFDNDLSGSWRSALPTPAARNNAVYSDNIPPHIRQVRHSPKQPKSGEVVTITAKVTDRDGVGSVALLYQIVDPGKYIGIGDRLWFNWTRVDMHDDGLGGDAEAGDDIYTAQLLGSLQTHRRLVRYRIIVTDTGGRTLLLPYPDDPGLNFAYFVYDGAPAWRGAVQPGVTPVQEYNAAVMRSLPVYHLIAKKSDVETATWFEHYGGSEYKWWGTLVYDGEVYDHIRFRARGGVWRYAMGKNMWKFDFNRGHSFQARDDYGNKYETKWDKINFSACIQQGSFGQRGEQGMFEALSMKLFNMVAVPTSKTNWVHFRIIDEPYEDGTLNAGHQPLTSRGTQYDGDFWGLYMTIEQMDGRFLNEHDLPDGNLYKMEARYGELNNQGPTAVTDGSDIRAFKDTYEGSPSAQWWQSNVNLESYYGLYAIYHAVWHGDITSKNHFFYQNPEPTATEFGESNLWWQLVWDVDLTWTCYYSDMKDPFSRSGIFSHSDINRDCRNRVREICDLLFNAEQMNQLIDEYAAIIDDPAGGPSMVDADRAMWDYHWVVGQGAYPQYLNQSASFKAGQGRFYQEAVDRGHERSFEGMVDVMKGFVVERQGHMRSISADSGIPSTPAVTATAPPDFPINSLTFQTSSFSDPQGSNTFGAMKWRIAEVAAGAVVAPPDEGIVLLPDGARWKYFKGTEEPSQTWGAWRRITFDDSHWLEGNTAIGYGETFIVTNLGDMRGNYSTLYLRKTFDVTDVGAIGKLLLEVKYDDGVNVWINGAYAGGGNVPSEELPFNATVSTRSESHDFDSITPLDLSGHLVVGTNVVAVQVINASLSSSSDCFIDVRLVVEAAEPGEPPSTPINYGREPGKYEIDAVWESSEITEFNKATQIPASVVRVGRTYRVRCRMKDNTGRWSHWSEPVQFVAGEPLSAGILDNLRVTELMYNPANPPAGDLTDNDDFEFIELKNIGDEALDLTYVSFVDGVTF
ncbi:MAG: lamin tail domain-containing protein, partial [Phycisphaerales bacterium]